ncbi:MAG: hypothetical protein E4H32_09410 [Nitrospirales bacterium]|nr:MAG: hypothetical protein E4H32_09410 [Nitrospirales bacterium]
MTAWWPSWPCITPRSLQPGLSKMGTIFDSGCDGVETWGGGMRLGIRLKGSRRFTSVCRELA